MRFRAESWDFPCGLSSIPVEPPKAVCRGCRSMPLTNCFSDLEDQFLNGAFVKVAVPEIRQIASNRWHDKTPSDTIPVPTEGFFS